MDIYDLLYFTENNTLWINMNMEFKNQTFWKISLLIGQREGGDTEPTVTKKAVNQTELVSVRKGTVVKVFQAWWLEVVGSIGPWSGPETWENAHTPITLTLQKAKYI